MAWFLIGAFVGTVNLITAVALVASMFPGDPKRFRRRVVCRHVIGYALVALLLFVAVRQSLYAGLAAGGGIWTVRWLGVYLGATGKLNWIWSR